MNNFEKKTYFFDGITYSRYECDRCKGQNSYVFYNFKPPGTIYSLSWPKDVEADSAFSGVQFISRLADRVLCIDFYVDLTEVQEEALDLLYVNHVAPIPI